MTSVAPRLIDDIRKEASSKLDPRRRSALGQFMTPTPIADFMAALFRTWPQRIRLLDPGAGIGSLTEAFVTQWLEKTGQFSQLELTTYEIDPTLATFLKEHVAKLTLHARQVGHQLKAKLEHRDFVREASFSLSLGGPRFTHIILNPPYKKINTNSEYRRLLSTIGVETVNLYTVFLALAVASCEQGGEVVAIVPRSFCNGTYYRSFRKWLMERVAITHIHVFESRSKAFSDDDVLQENIIVHLVRGATQGDVLVSSSHDGSFTDYEERQHPFEDIVKPDDVERFIHVPTSATAVQSTLFVNTLRELGLEVSTGPVVDFRVRDHWLSAPTAGSAPLLYAHHFAGQGFRWPQVHRKPNALVINEETKKWLMPRGWYALTKRFSSKEEKRRIVAYTIGPEQLNQRFYGFENHLNVIHAGKQGLSEELARGIALFLNSTVVDSFFRTFSGHTQVNATDLRTIRFPNKQVLTSFGKWANKRKVTQEEIDQFIENHHANG